jgi:Transposase IS116/IS110/IS902 family
MKKRPRRPRKEIAPQQAIPAPRAAKGTKRLVFKSGATMDVPADVSLRPLPTEESVFRLLYRLIEDIQRVRLSHGNRVRQVLPLIPPTITPPRTIPTWEAFFKISAETLAQEEARLLSLATQLLKQDPVGRWLLAQKGVGPALAVSILGECWPLSRFRNPGKLWAFSGLDVANGAGVNKAHPRMTADGEKSYRWNWRLKTRLYLFGVSVVRAGGPWRDLYDQVKAVELEKLGRAHSPDDDPEVSPPLGRPQTGADAPMPVSAPGGAHGTPDAPMRTAPAGAPRARDPHTRTAPGGAHDSPDAPTTSAPAGENLEADRAQQDHDDQESPEPVGLRGHAHNRALRKVAKSLLLDLWRVAHDQPPLVGAV